MALDAKYLYVVMMDVEPDKEDLFNKTYDEEHIPVLTKVPGVISAARYKTSDQGVARYLAIYELESPDVPNSEVFRKASDSGEWPTKVCPFARTVHASCIHRYCRHLRSSRGVSTTMSLSSRMGR
jgi:hypothetical protein